MTADPATRKLIQQLFESNGMELTDEDLTIVSQLHGSFAEQRSQLRGAARPETEPMIIPAFDRIQHEAGATDERDS